MDLLERTFNVYNFFNMQQKPVNVLTFLNLSANILVCHVIVHRKVNNSLLVHVYILKKF